MMETIYKNLIQKLAEEKRDVSQKKSFLIKKKYKNYKIQIKNIKYLQLLRFLCQNSNSKIF